MDEHESESSERPRRIRTDDPSELTLVIPRTPSPGEFHAKVGCGLAIAAALSVVLLLMAMDDGNGTLIQVFGGLVGVLGVGSGLAYRLGARRAAANEKVEKTEDGIVIREGNVAFGSIRATHATHDRFHGSTIRARAGSVEVDAEIACAAEDPVTVALVASIVPFQGDFHLSIDHLLVGSGALETGDPAVVLPLPFSIVDAGRRTFTLNGGRLLDTKPAAMRETISSMLDAVDSLPLDNGERLVERKVLLSIGGFRRGEMGLTLAGTVFGGVDVGGAAAVVEKLLSKLSDSKKLKFMALVLKRIRWPIVTERGHAWTVERVP